MADLNLTQAEADALIAMEKHRSNEDRTDFPNQGQLISLPLQSKDRREQFLLDIRRGRIDLQKITFQNRGRQVIVLVRLDVAGAPHRNPDGEEIAVPHLHVYREGYGDKWATTPPQNFSDPANIWTTLEDFLRYCNVTQPPLIRRGLFE